MEKWDIVYESVRGALHQRLNIVNQDSIRVSDNGEFLVVAISDGHGGAKYFRSDVGSEFAVNSAVDVIEEFFSQKVRDSLWSQKKQANYNHNRGLNQIVHEKIPKEFIMRWKEKVMNHLEAHPLLLSEIEKQNEPPEYFNANPLVPYGATLIAAAIFENQVIFWQLGDGDILNVFDDRQICCPFEKDRRLFANETTSLCLKNAWSDFRVCVRNTDLDLIIMSTDGYSNSFIDQQGFYNVGLDIMDIIKADGIEYIKENIASWLKQTSEEGSGDDITMAVICRNKEASTEDSADVNIKGTEAGERDGFSCC